VNHSAAAAAGQSYRHQTDRLRSRARARCRFIAAHASSVTFHKRSSIILDQFNVEQRLASKKNPLRNEPDAFYETNPARITPERNRRKGGRSAMAWFEVNAPSTPQRTDMTV
jgi:hypothetical protein